MKPIARPEAGFLQQKNSMSATSSVDPPVSEFQRGYGAALQAQRGQRAENSRYNPSGIVPSDTKVLVRPDPVEEKTTGGVFLPDAAKDKQKYATVRATLIARGPNAFLEWGPSGDDYEPGVRIIMAQYAGMRAKGEDGVEYTLINDEDVVAVLAESST